MREVDDRYPEIAKPYEPVKGGKHHKRLDYAKIPLLMAGALIALSALIHKPLPVIPDGPEPEVVVVVPTPSPEPVNPPETTPTPDKKPDRHPRHHHRHQLHLFPRHPRHQRRVSNLVPHRSRNRILNQNPNRNRLPVQNRRPESG